MDEPFLVALDVEWTKNYKVKNGSRPFCYSLVLLHLPIEGDTLDRYPTTFGFKSVYISTPDDEPALLAELDRDMQAWTASGSLLGGHQLSSDLAIVRSAGAQRLPGVEAVYDQWSCRRSANRRVFDTRYDVDHLPLGPSRRLVDVCGDLKLDVTQPELARGSMTKLQRNFLLHGDEAIRERLLTLNVRHSLSTAMVAAHGLGLVGLGPRNINDMLRQEMWDLVTYIRGDDFASLLTTPRR